MSIPAVLKNKYVLIKSQRTEQGIQSVNNSVQFGVVEQIADGVTAVVVADSVMFKYTLSEQITVNLVNYCLVLEENIILVEVAPL